MSDEIPKPLIVHDSIVGGWTYKDVEKAIHSAVAIPSHMLNLLGPKPSKSAVFASAYGASPLLGVFKVHKQMQLMEEATAKYRQLHWPQGKKPLPRKSVVVTSQGMMTLKKYGVILVKGDQSGT